MQTRPARERRSPLLPMLLCACAAVAVHSAAPQGRPAARRDIEVVRLTGSAYERGLQHGTQLRSAIAALIALWKEDLRNATGADPDARISSFLRNTNFAPAIERWTPDLLDEVRGIADGAKQPFETIFAFQLVDELWVFNDKGGAEHCTSVGVARRGDHPAYVAQNTDLEAFRDGFQVVLHIVGTASAPEQFVLTSAGLIGINGVNARSVAIVCNTLIQLGASSDGLPVAFVVRGVLAKGGGDAASGFIKSVRHASGQNYVLGDGDRVQDFEASSGKVVEFRPAADGSVVYHTNHPVANDDVKPWHRAATDWLTPAQRRGGNSETRFASIEARLRRPAGQIGEDVIKDALRSKDSLRHPICRPLVRGAATFTFAAAVMTLSGTPSLQVTMGPPDENAFVRFEFSPRPLVR